MAVITARLLRKFWFKKDETPFVMELPPYRIPTAKATVRNMWAKARQYLQKMGGLILVASIIIWVLSYFPRFSEQDVPATYIENAVADMPASTFDDRSQEEVSELILNEYQQEHSILADIAKGVEPVMAPMDFDWKVCSSLLAGAAAKEVVVSTLGVLYVGDDDTTLLSEKISSPSPLTGKAPFNKAKAIAFMVFVLLYFPCIATIASIIRESGSWKYGVFAMVYNTTLAWILAFLTYRIAMLF